MVCLLYECARLPLVSEKVDDDHMKVVIAEVGLGVWVGLPGGGGGWAPSDQPCKTGPPLQHIFGCSGSKRLTGTFSQAHPGEAITVETQLSMRMP